MVINKGMLHPSNIGDEIAGNGGMNIQDTMFESMHELTQNELIKFQDGGNFNDEINGEKSNG